MVEVALISKRGGARGELGPFNFSMPGCCCCVPPAGTSKGQAPAGGQCYHAQPGCSGSGAQLCSIIALRSKEAAPGRVGFIQFPHVGLLLLLRAAGEHQQRAGDCEGATLPPLVEVLALSAIVVVAVDRR